MIITKFSCFLQTFLLFIFLVLNLYEGHSKFGGDGAECLKRERAALLQFKAGLVDDYGWLSSWESTNCCEWKGVVCDNLTNHIVALDLHGDFNLDGDGYQGAHLGGKISSSLLQLPHLYYLDLSFNDFNGTNIPSFIGHLNKLEHLNLSSSNIGGLIPHHIGNLSALRLLDLGRNWQISATNLDWLSGFHSLEYLDLSYASLVRCTTWMQAISKLTALKQLHLSNCDLPTPILVPSHNSSNSLVVLDLSSNSLSSPVLLWFVNMSSSITYIDFSGSNLEGGVPDALGSLMLLDHLDLQCSNLRGRIPKVLGNLCSLSYLDLSWNQLQGEFPEPSKNFSSLTYLDLSGNKLNKHLHQLLTWIGDSTRLTYLDLSYNELRGTFPNMSRFSLLKMLHLGNNQLNGALLEDNLRLPNLERLDLSSNKLSGVLPNLSRLPQLIFLDLSFNLNVTISINPSWGQPVQFVYLNLANCNLGPYFPKWLRNQNQLKFLDISNSKIFDIVPDWFWGSIHECEYLNMSHNHIHGFLPNSSSQFKEIGTLDLSSNEFTGPLPLLPPTVNTIYLSKNKFSGTIHRFCNFLENFSLFVDLSNNLLTGEIPQDCFVNLLRRAYLNLAHNNFSGVIPTTSSLSCSVFSLHLRNNSFRGEIPSALRNCSELTVLDLGENKFSGKIPWWLGESMPQLGVLILKSNMLSGSLPSRICHLSNLHVLDISMNKVNGTIPQCINNFTLLSSEAELQLFSSARNGSISDDFHDSASIVWKGNEETYIKSLGLLKVIDLSSNELSGEIPHGLTSLIGVLGLNLSRNNLVGFIPRDIDKLNLLNFLDLSRNKLSGGIPDTLSKLSHLGVLNLSFNNLSGRIPWETHMQTFGASTYLGNPRLCGQPLVSTPCPEDAKPSNGGDDDSDSEDEEHRIIMRGFYVSMVLGFVVAFWVMFWALFFNKWWNVVATKICTTVADWLYVQILIQKRRLLRYFDKA